MTVLVDVAMPEIGTAMIWSKRAFFKGVTQSAIISWPYLCRFPIWKFYKLGEQAGLAGADGVAGREMRARKVGRGKVHGSRQVPLCNWVVGSEPGGGDEVSEFRELKDSWAGRFGVGKPELTAGRALTRCPEIIRGNENGSDQGTDRERKHPETSQVPPRSAHYCGALVVDRERGCGRKRSGEERTRLKRNATVTREQRAVGHPNDHVEGG